MPAVHDDAPAVLHVTAAAGGGADRYVRSLAASARRRHHVLHVGPGRDVLEDVAAARFLPLDATREELGSALARWSRAAGVGIVHLHGVDAACRSRLAALQAASGLPYLVTLHDLLFVDPHAFDAAHVLAPDPGWIAGLAGTLERAAIVVVPSDYIRATAQRHIPRARIDVIAPGIGAIAAGIAGPAARPAPPAPPDFAAHAPPHVVAVAGAIGPHKGSELLAPLAGLLAGSSIALVVIGYTDTRLARGWVVPGRLFVHGPYVDEALPGWLAAYRAELALFPNRLPESFSYTLSEVWTAGLPVIVPDDGALGERVARHGGGWRLPAGFTAADAAALLARLFAPGGGEERARVKSELDAPDADRVPTLAAMTATVDTLYTRYAALPPADADPALAAEALAPLLAANLDGFVFRQELVNLADERDALEGRFAESQQWNAKLEGDIAALKAEIERLATANRALADDKAAFDQLPRALRDLLMKRALRARG